MNESSDFRLEIARNSYTTLLQRLRDETSQTAVAKAMGKHKSTISRLVNEHAESLFVCMALVDLKAVDINAEFLTEVELNSLRCLAGRGLQTFGTKDNT